MALWLVRCGRHGEKEVTALREGSAIIGWDELPSLAGLASREELAGLIATCYPEAGDKTRLNWVSQIWPFLNVFKPNDLVVMPLRSQPAVAVGRIGVGGYRYREDLPVGLRHHRAVDWILDPIPRAAFDQDILYSFGAAMTVCSVSRNDAERRVEAMLVGTTVRDVGSLIAVSDERDASAPDIEEQARDGIRKLIARRFTGHDLTALIRALLETDGYVARQSPEGADGGIDIVAGRGPLGFDSPRLAVQVKSGDSASDIRMVRELQGVMRKFGAEHGLFVSWGGYRGTVEREVARDFFGVRLWTSDDVIAAIENAYDRLPAAIQADLPLKRVWTVVAA